jgi:hypothetical protein
MVDCCCFWRRVREGGEERKLEGGEERKLEEGEGKGEDGGTILEARGQVVRLVQPHETFLFSS